jgi:hypothetical protein
VRIPSFGAARGEKANTDPVESAVWHSAADFGILAGEATNERGAAYARVGWPGAYRRRADGIASCRRRCG